MIRRALCEVRVTRNRVETVVHRGESFDFTEAEVDSILSASPRALAPAAEAPAPEVYQTQKTGQSDDL
jgi:hypothetical protein